MADYPKRQPDLEQVKQALQILTDYANELDEDDPKFRASEQRYSQRTRVALWIIVLSLIPGALDVAYPHLGWNLVFILLLVTAVIRSVWAIWLVTREQQEILQFYAKPKQTVLKRLASTLDTETKYLNQLLALEYEALTLTYARLEQATENLKDKTESLFGLVSKVGLFPGIVAIGVALIPALKSSGNNLILVVLAALLFWNHNVSYNLQLSLIELKQIAGLVKRALSIEQEEAAAIPIPAAVPADSSLTD